MHSFTQDLTCVTYPLLFETMHLRLAQPGLGGGREAFKTTSSSSFGSIPSE